MKRSLAGPWSTTVWSIREVLSRCSSLPTTQNWRETLWPGPCTCVWLTGWSTSWTSNSPTRARSCKNETRSQNKKKTDPSFNAFSGDRHMISIMDLFGFECFQKNGIEQLFVNSLNEQLQYHFTQRLFAWEMVSWYFFKIGNLRRARDTSVAYQY